MSTEVWLPAANDFQYVRFGGRGEGVVCVQDLIQDESKRGANSPDGDL
jgi:hypothetical protein